MQQILGLVILMLFGCVVRRRHRRVAGRGVLYVEDHGQQAPGRPAVQWAAVGYFRPNIVFRPGLLTERGLGFRRRFGQAVTAFAAAVAAGLLLDGMVRMLP